MRVGTFYLLLFFSLNGFGQDRPFITTWKTDNPGASCEACIEILTYEDDYNYDYSVDWDMDGIYDVEGLTGNFTHDFGVPGTYVIGIKGDFPQFYSGTFLGDARKLIAVTQWGDIKWKNFNSAFRSCPNLDLLAEDKPDLSQVKDMQNMFYLATNINADLSEWDVSSVQDMSGMFNGATSFNGNLSDWDVSSVENMNGMFAGATSFMGSIKNWDVSFVNDMSSMFSGAQNFNGDLSNWDVSSVTTMAGMFNDAISFNANISAWDVSLVTSMAGMFRSATAFNQDLSDWDVSSVKFPFNMFNNAASFNQDLSDWDISSVEFIVHMLDDCGMEPLTYQSTLEGWASNPMMPDSLSLGSLNLEYCDNAPREKLFLKGWTIIGDSQADEEDCTTASDDLHKLDPILYPTPSIDHLNIAHLDVMGRYDIYDAFGIKRQEENYHQYSTIRIDDLPPGLYYLIIRTKEKNYSFNFVKTER